MKNLIEKTKTMYKKSFTLIELISVIVVIGILAAIVIPNISSFKEEARITAMVADGKNLQTAVDMYQLDQHGDFPTVKSEGDSSSKPVLGTPQSVDFHMLYPTYIRDLPQAKNMYYWIDYQGQFYYSAIDNPNDFIQGDAELTWTANEKATGYTVYEVGNKYASSSKQVTLKELAKLEGTVDSFHPKEYSKEKTYLINVVDEYGNEAAPVKSGYKGTAPFIPEEVSISLPPKEPVPSPTIPGESEPVIVPTTPEQEELVSNPNNKMVAAGGEHSMVIDENGTLWSFGHNQFGQLGYVENSGTYNSNPTPKRVMEGASYVATGSFHTLVVKENGELWSFGHNKFGQLGHSTNNRYTKPNPTPEKVMDDVKSVSAGSYHTLVLKENGELWSFGVNTYGQLGHSANINTTNANPIPEKVLDRIKFVSAGYNHTLVIKEVGELWSFGYNNSGQLGHFTNINTGNANHLPEKIMDKVSSVSAGSDHTLVVKENGELWSFGHNSYGQLGHIVNIGTNKSNGLPKKILGDVKSVSAGSFHSLVLKNNGELLSFGNNQYGQLGHSVNSGSTSPVFTHSKIMDGVTSISTGLHHSIVVKENEELWSFGYNNSGQLGYSTSRTIISNPSATKILLPIE